MKYCLRGTLPKEQVELADEILLEIPYPMTLIEFIDKYRIENIIKDFGNKKIIISNVRKEDYQALYLLEYDNVMISMLTISDLIYMMKSDFKRKEKLFTMEPVISYDIYSYLTNDLDVKRVVVNGALGFDMFNLKLFSDDIEIMVNPCEIMFEKGKINSFFIRPEDIEYFEKYVDILYFPESKEDDNREFVSFKAYSKDKIWFGKLNEIVVGLESEINNRYFSWIENEHILKAFRYIRPNCKKNCLRGGNGCSICYELEEISKLIKNKENDIINNIKN